MSTFRLIRGELQKVLLRPLMYILTLVLVLGLVGSVVLFDNTIADRQNSGYTIAGETKSEVYANYLSGTTISKSIADQKLSQSKNMVDKYAVLNSTPAETSTAQLKTILASLTGELEIYKNNIQATSSTETDLSTLNQNRENLKQYTERLKQTFNSSINGSIRSILISQNDYNMYVGIIGAVHNYLTSAIDTNSLDDHRLLLDRLSTAISYSSIQGTSYFDKLNTLTNQCITDVTISGDDIARLTTLYTTASAYLVDLNDRMAEALNDDTVSLAEYKNIALSYFYTSKQYSDLVQNSIAYYPVANYGDAQITSLIGYTSINSYQLRQDIARDAFLIENNLTQNTTAYPFSSGTSFSNTASALDLVYFGLEICGFIIIVLCIVLIAGMLAGENARGTLRVQALRPYSRGQILSSKIWATIILGFIMLLFSALVLFFAGWIMYGIDFTPILAIFDASHAFVISPIALIFIYLGLLVFKMIFYILLATLIATLCKNEIAAILIPVLLYVANAVLAFVFSSTYWYAYVPFASVDLFKFLGGGMAIAHNPISIVLSTPIFYNTSFVYSICMSVGLVLIMAIVSHIRFKDSEIR